MADRPEFANYEEFWLFYVREHANPVNRALHFIGTTLAVALLVYLFVVQNWWLLLAVPILGYGFAWFGHFFVENNKPASFKYPGWSFISDFRMWATIATGRMGAEVQRAMSAASE